MPPHPPPDSGPPFLVRGSTPQGEGDRGLWFHLYLNGRGNRPAGTARPRDFPHSLPSNIETLGAYTMNAAPCGSHPTFIGSVLEKCSRISPDRHYTISVKETGPEGRLQSQGHITSFVLNIKALGTLYHSFDKKNRAQVVKAFPSIPKGFPPIPTKGTPA